MLFLKKVVACVFIVCSFAACVSTKKLTENTVYFKNISDSILQRSSLETEPAFQKGDILSITVMTPNEKSARLFNQGGYLSSSGISAESASPVQANASQQGYLINEKGNITFPYLGYIKALGETATSLSDIISKRLSSYIDSAIVSIRLMNYRVTVLGEVTRPGTFTIPSERVTVLDAIGLAGDLTIYGRRNNIRIIRSVDGQRQTATLDLNKGDIFNSPYFFLRQNDIVYVEPNERKIPNTDQASLRNVSIGLGIISAIGVIISTIYVLR